MTGILCPYCGVLELNPYVNHAMFCPSGGNPKICGSSVVGAVSNAQASGSHEYTALEWAAKVKECREVYVFALEQYEAALAREARRG